MNNQIEEQEGTRLEKALLVLLVAFLLVAGFWVLDRMEKLLPQPVLSRTEQYGGIPDTGSGPTVEDELGLTPMRAQVKKYQELARVAAQHAAEAGAQEQKARQTYEFRREEYRTAMEANRATPDKKVGFETARARYAKIGAIATHLGQESEAANRRLDHIQKDFDKEERHAQSVYDQRTLKRNIRLFLLHFGFAALCIALSWILWRQGREHGWPYQAILSAFFVASILQLLFLCFRYCWELFVQDFGVLAIALLGALVCVLAIVGIKRWLFSPTRLAEARLAARRCPHCATPFADSQLHCWHCGQALYEPCLVCKSNRLRYAPFCEACGAGRAEPVQES